MKKVVFASICGLGIVGSAAAVTAQSGIYGSGLVGWAFPESPSSSQLQTNSESNQNFTLGANLGYEYAFTQNFMAGLELGYIDFGRTKYNNIGSSLNGGEPTWVDTNLKTAGIQMMATGTFLASNGFNVFAKAGAIDETTESSTNFLYLIPTADASVTQWLPAVAVGVGYMLVQNINLTLQYEHTFGANWNSDPWSKPMTQNALMLGLTCKIGW